MPTIYAKSENSNKQSAYIDQNRGFQLAKEGYAFRLQSDKNNEGLWHKPTGTNNYDLVTHKTFQQLIKNKTNFKIYRVWHYKNGLQYKIVSQSGRYRGWIDNAGVYNKYSLDKKLQPIIQQEQKVVNGIAHNYPKTVDYKSRDLKQYQSDLNKASKESASLRGHQKLVALNSIKQVKMYVKTHDSNFIPTLLWQKVK